MIRAGTAAALLGCIAWAILAVAPAAPSTFGDGRATPDVLVEREAHLMGTRARLAVYAPGRLAGLERLEAALERLEATEAQLSTWRADSAISHLNNSPVDQPWQADPQVCALLADVYEWHAATEGAFDPAIGALARSWGIHDGGRVPATADIEDALRRSGLARVDFDRRACRLTRRADVTLDVGGFGKGEALDRVAALLGDTAWLADLGGQVSVNAPPAAQPWTIDIAHPAARHRPHLQVLLRTGSLATSAGSERDLSVNGRRVGHILDPRTGRPAPFGGSVTVWHARALVADILSTALYVMGPDAGIRWAETRGVAALFLVPDGVEVRMLPTTRFTHLLTPAAGGQDPR